MAISDNIRKMGEDIKKQTLEPPGGKSELAQRVQAKAIKAIFGGPAEWADYMQQFSKSSEELARLIPTDGSTSEKQTKARAYLLSNGMCGETTTGTLIDNVEEDLNL